MGIFMIYVGLFFYPPHLREYFVLIIMGFVLFGIIAIVRSIMAAVTLYSHQKNIRAKALPYQEGRQHDFSETGDVFLKDDEEF